MENKVIIKYGDFITCLDSNTGVQIIMRYCSFDGDDNKEINPNKYNDKDYFLKYLKIERDNNILWENLNLIN